MVHGRMENMMEKRPNILWICSDQQRKDTLGCYGNPFTNMPNLDRLAAAGVKFTSAYAQNPICMPSRVSFLTGRYPRTCQVRYNGQNAPKEAGEHMISHLLKEEGGYMCGLAGKLHTALCNPSVTPVIEPRLDDGYDYFAWSHEPGPRWPMNAYTMWLNNCGVSYKTVQRADCRYVQNGMPEEYHQTKWCADQAIAFMDNAKNYDVPWMFSFNCFDPHHPFDPPEEYLERYLQRLDEIPLPRYSPSELDEKCAMARKNHAGAYRRPGFFAYDEMTEKDHRMIKAAYWAMCDLIDVQVGRMLDYLESSGQMENTIVIFHSDHGESLGDHGIYLKGAYFYEECVNVPLIISWPGKFRSGVTSQALVELVDLVPTLLDVCGLPAHPAVQGRSLAPLLRGETDPDTFRDSVYSELYADKGNAVPHMYTTMVRDRRYKLTRVHAAETEEEKESCPGELYDLGNDPGETRNLYREDSAADIRQYMLELMCDRMALTCDPFPLSRYFHGAASGPRKNGTF